MNTKKRDLSNKKNINFTFIILILIIIDQIVKLFILNRIYNSSIIILKGILNFTYIENTGGAYGIGTNSTFMFIVINIIIIVILIKFMICKKNELNLSVLTGISLIIAGGTGNLIDRVFRGHVIDYIDINPMFKYPVFNIADICVVVGCIIIIINIIINIIKTRNE